MATGQKLDRYAIQLSDLAALSAWHPLRLLLFPVITEETANLGTKFDAVGLVVRHTSGDRIARPSPLIQPPHVIGGGCQVRRTPYPRLIEDDRDAGRLIRGGESHLTGKVILTLVRAA
jgi:hypothetical protein